jgi:cytochrome c556
MQRTPTLLVLAVAVVAAGAARPKPPVRRATPPARWDKTVAALFADDAFTLLEGARPADFGRPAPAPGAAGAGTETAAESRDPVASGDFDRSDMMKKLKAAEEALAEILSGEKTFETGGARAGQAADLVAMMGRTLFSGDPDFGTEDDYLKFAEDMMSAAKQLKILVTKRDYAGARGCFDKVKKSCDGCHEGYR